MSNSDKVRYFRSLRRNPREVPSDIYAERGIKAERLAKKVDYTEVQVVPLDALVILRDELPEVEERNEPAGPYLFADGVWVQDDGYETGMDRALAHVAVALYRKGQPPVDEEQVKAVTAIIDEDEAWGEDGSSATLARRLVQRGVRVEAT